MSELKEIGIRWEENGEMHFSHVYLKSKVDPVIAKKDAENRRLKRALWLARARTACLEFKLFVKDSVDAVDSIEVDNAERMAIKWKKVERKCRAKAEEYK